MPECSQRRPSGFRIGNRPIGPGQPPYIVAELSANHNGNLDRALAIVEAAKDAGCDAVKLQTLAPEAITLDYDGPGFMVCGGRWDGYRLYDLYREAQTPWPWHEALFRRGRELGLHVFSAPFDAHAVAFLAGLDAPAYKIASFEAVDLPLIAAAAGTGRPLIISTGMADLGEITDAVNAARNAGAADVALLHCVSAYPASAEDANLRTIPHLADAFGVPVGLSDHTLGTAVAVAAVSLGACIIEKHMTLSRAEGGLDAEFSLEPAEMAALVRDCRSAWAALGGVHYGRAASEANSMTFRRSLYVVRDVSRGQPLTGEDVRSIRPGLGLKPKHLEAVLGRRARQDLKRGTPLDWWAIE